MDRRTTRLWVFGYGSLCWNPGFQFDDAVTGCIKGFSRKFWQGNVTHRGVQGKPGRVATIVEDKEEEVWGRAFQLSGEAALPYLDNRECVLGGYITRITTFYPRPRAKPFTRLETESALRSDAESVFLPEAESVLRPEAESAPWPEAESATLHEAKSATRPEAESASRPEAESALRPFPVLVYVAAPGNAHWLGEAPLYDIASQIVSSHGPSGHNVEYLLRLASFMRDSVPEAEDSHLFTLEFLVRSRIKESKMCLRSLMGEGEGAASQAERQPLDQPQAQPQAAQAPRPSSFEFTSRVPPKKLRCLNI